MNKVFFYIVLSLCTLLTYSVKGQSEEVDLTIEEVNPTSNEQLWESGNQSYISKDYATAIDSYNAILNSGVNSAELFYNLANAYYKQDDMAKAILYYNKAAKLAPTDSDTLYNLTVAQERIKDNIDELPEFFMFTLHKNMYSMLNSGQWAIFSLILLLFAGVFMLLFLLSPKLQLRKVGFFAMLVSFVLSASATSYSIGQRREMLDDTKAIVMVKSVTAKSSPDYSSTDLFILHEGTKVEIGKQIGLWSEITIADGKQGWILSENIETI